MEDKPARSKQLWDAAMDPDTVTLVSGWFTAVVGLVSGVLAFFSLRQLQSLSTSDQAAAAAVNYSIGATIYGVLLTLALAAAIYVAYRRRKAHDRLKALEVLDLRVSEARMQVAQEHYYYCQYQSEWKLKAPSFDNLKHQTQDYLTKMLSRTRELFTTYTGADCGVCVKIFSEHRDQFIDDLAPAHRRPGQPPPQYVYTLRRDEASQAKRRTTDDNCLAYLYADNTAFSAIFDVRDAPDHFLCNNLKALPKYRNANTDWDKHYNATVVLPIKRPEKRASEMSIGAICVDNMPGGFDDRCVHILEGIAVDLYYSLRRYTDLLDEFNQKRE